MTLSGSLHVLQVAYAEYELDAIMLTGSCSEISPGKQLPPPKGLELNLGTEQQPHAVSNAATAVTDT
jgi:UDP-glucose:glycoprotein glucosyltransferase